MAIGLTELLCVAGAIGLAALLIVKVFSYDLMEGKKDSGASAAEAQLIQEIHQGLMRMEDRIEALETILLDRDRKETKS